EGTVSSGLSTGTTEPEVDAGHGTDHQDERPHDAKHRLATAVMRDLVGPAGNRPSGTTRTGDARWGCAGSAAVLCGPVSRAAPTLRWWHRVFPSPGARTRRARHRASRRASTPRARSPHERQCQW